MVRACCFLLLALVPPLAAAQVYRWVDDKGQVHYSQVPPPGTQTRAIGPAPPPSAAPNQEALNKSLAEDQAGAAERAAAAEQAAKASAEREAQCKQAREQLAFMESKTAVRLTTTDDKGNVSRVTEEQFQARRAELQKAVSERCS